jgi:hypothetical protein
MILSFFGSFRGKMKKCPSIAAHDTEKHPAGCHGDLPKKPF